MGTEPHKDKPPPFPFPTSTPKKDEHKERQPSKEEQRDLADSMPGEGRAGD